ncbi:hypothetical protein EN813_023945 [Mesorhizobium sp. M00.F.Ca.ET.170.01.1.1]|nr:hypothetical protein EN813_023945 [Mesorhizobium sp. M00.F.Ca.ET.170.01.1.1]
MHMAGRYILLISAALAPSAFPTFSVAEEASPPILASPTTRLIGITATGPQADLDRLQALTRKSSFPSKQMNSPEGWEIFVVFPAGSDPSAVAAFLDRLRSSEFATLQFGAATAPLDQ